MAVVAGESGGTWLQHDNGTFRKVSPLRVWLVLGGTGLALLLVVSSGLFALVWLPRTWLGRWSAAEPRSVRVAPLLGLAGLVGFGFCYVRAGDAGYAVLGTCNEWTLGMLLCSLLLPLGALGSGVAVWRHRQTTMHRGVYWHAVAVTLGLVWLTGFCLHWGMIGVRMWV